MSEIDLFKKIAMEKLPESLYGQLEPYIGDMLERYLAVIDARVWRLEVACSIASDCFKLVAIKKLPESLYRQLEPYIGDMMGSYHAAVDLESVERGAKITAEFRKQIRAAWPSFARQRWPDIDKYFNLYRRTDDAPSNW